MQGRAFCEGCLDLLEDHGLVDTDMIPSNFHGTDAVPTVERDVVVCESCLNMAERYGWFEVQRLKDYFGIA